jgi:hypothetical protein
VSRGDRYNIKTADHADLPPAEEETGQRNPWFIVYNGCGSSQISSGVSREMREKGEIL